MPALLISYSSPLLDSAVLLSAALPELFPALVEPPTSELPRVRRERRGGSALINSAKNPGTPCASRPFTMDRGYAATGMVEGIKY